jgi:hypothetical protein
MNAEFCEFEEAVVAAIANGEWSDSLRHHVANCGQCADLQLISEYLRQVTAREEEATVLPTPSFLWWRAQLAERQEKAQQALAAIEIVQKLAIAFAVICLILFAWLWTPLHGGTLLAALGLSVSTGLVLFGWVRGRI